MCEITEQWKNASNRDKCLEHWNWNTENNAKDKKSFFVEYLKMSDNLKILCEAGAFLCFSCQEVGYNNDAINCSVCPIEWISDRDNVDNDAQCEYLGSPYFEWDNSPTQQNAKAVLFLIEETWKE